MFRDGRGSRTLLPIIGRIWASSTRTISRCAVSMCVAIVMSSVRLLEAQYFVDEDDSDAPECDLPVDDEHLVHPAVDAVCRLSAGVFERERVLVDAAETLLDVRHDLLRSHEENHSPGAADIRSELAAAHRGREQRPGFSDGGDAAEHHVWRRGEAAHFGSLRLALHAPDPR